MFHHEINLLLLYYTTFREINNYLTLIILMFSCVVPA